MKLNFDFVVRGHEQKYKNFCGTESLGKGWQLHQITWGHGLQWLACLLPGRHAADDDERVESLFPQLQRHPGAGCLAGSSTVDINVLILGKGLEFLGKIIGFNAE